MNKQIQLYYYDTLGWLFFVHFLEETEEDTKKTHQNWLTLRTYMFIHFWKSSFYTVFCIIDIKNIPPQCLKWIYLHWACPNVEYWPKSRDATKEKSDGHFSSLIGACTIRMCITLGSLYFWSRKPNLFFHL